MDDYTDKFILSVLHNISDFYLIYFAFHKRVFAVGVTSKIDMAELVTITGDPNKVFFVDAYADLYSILEPLQKVMALHHNLGIRFFGKQKSLCQNSSEVCVTSGDTFSGGPKSLVSVCRS